MNKLETFQKMYENYELKEDEEMCLSNNLIKENNDDKIMKIEDSIKSSLLLNSNKKDINQCDKVLKFLIIFIGLGVIAFGITLIYLFVH